MSIPIAGSESSELSEEKRRVERILDGSEEGILSSAYIESEDKSKLKSAVTSANSECREQLKVNLIGKAIYAAAQLRDAPYTCFGRKFMRTVGVRTHLQVAYDRAVILEHIKAFSE